MKKVELYVLDDAMKFDKKYYGAWGKQFPRPISVKSVLYFVVPFLFLIFMNFIPFLDKFAISFRKAGLFYAAIPFAISYFLTDTRTDERAFFRYLRGVIAYAYRRLIGVSYYRDKMLYRKKTYTFYNVFLGGYLTYKERDERSKKK